MSSNTYGYVRVSTREQNEDRQLIALKDYKVLESNIYVDKLSGRDYNRPQYQKLMKKIRPGDLIVVKSIDRLGRNYEDISGISTFLDSVLFAIISSFKTDKIPSDYSTVKSNIQERKNLKYRSWPAGHESKTRAFRKEK